MDDKITLKKARQTDRHKFGFEQKYVRSYNN